MKPTGPTDPPPRRTSSYDRRPSVAVPGDHRAEVGADVWLALAAAGLAASSSPVVLIDCYPGVDLPELRGAIEAALPEWDVVDVEDAAFSGEHLDAMLAHHLTDDRVFGVVSHHRLPDFYDAEALAALSARVRERTSPTVVIGWGAALVDVGSDVLVLADMARWEIQRRLRAGASTWRRQNPDLDVLRKYKQGFFIDWRVADRHKRELFGRVDFLLDTNDGVEAARLITGGAFRGGLAEATRRPFRVVPFFDPGVWGGQWMKEVCGLDPESPNYAWCFDCVPEENSLLLDVGGVEVEIPSIDVVLAHPRELLGERTYARFGANFPIRFDFLDTMGGGNLSLQVHPQTDYIAERFGMAFTQDESYYLLDAGDDAVVYLGTKTGTDPERMLAALEEAQSGEVPFLAQEYVNTLPAKKHDHFLIPAGTVHCSGANSMVLEISATPFIFTFKMWDWGRVGLDGVPRPIHLEHAAQNIRWERDTEWVTANLVDQVTPLREGDGWRIERTGLHELEFIETERAWFTGTVSFDTAGTVNVLNLVQGDEAVVESLTGAFEPFVVHYAETFIVPADAGAYTIRPAGAGESGIVRTFVRGT